jgi:DNA-binding ferritin-like protein
VTQPDPAFADALRTGFTSQYAFGIKAQHIHWNVVGRNFYEDHLLLERIYTEVLEAVDPFAENLRKCRIMVPASTRQIANMSVVEDFSADSQPALEMIAALAADADKMADLMSALFEIAERNGEHGLSNFLADRQDNFRGHSWMLRSTVQN